MTAFVVKRVISIVPVLFGVSIIAFLMSHLVPGDPVAVMLGQHGTAADRARLREELGLDDPIYTQYARFLRGALQGDLGKSIRSGQPVLQEIQDRFASTLELTATAILVAVAVGVTLGVAAAASR